MSDAASILSLTIEAHDGATRVLRQVSAETKAMVDQQQAGLRRLQETERAVNVETQRYKQQLAALKAETSAAGKATATQTAEMRGL